MRPNNNTHYEQTASEEDLKCKTEKEIFAILKFMYKEPWERG